MSDTVRFGVSLSLELLDRFDALIKGLGYGNRSEAVRDLIRNKLVEEEWQEPDGETFCCVPLILKQDADEPEDPEEWVGCSTTGPHGWPAIFPALLLLGWLRIRAARRSS